MGGRGFYFNVELSWETVDGWKCPECGKLYEKKEPLISHYWYSHTEEGQEHRKVVTQKAQQGFRKKIENLYYVCPICLEKISKARQRRHSEICRQITPEIIQKCEDLYAIGHDFEQIQRKLGLDFSKKVFIQQIYSKFDPVKRDKAREKRKKGRISKTIRSMYDSGSLCRVPIICDMKSPEIFRTRKEREVASILTSFSVKWEYESFIIHYTNRRGVYTLYLPDFYLPEFHLILEIKGDQQAKKSKTLDTAKASIENGYKFKLILNKMVSEEHLFRVLRGYGWRG